MHTLLISRLCSAVAWISQKVGFSLCADLVCFQRIVCFSCYDALSCFHS